MSRRRTLAAGLLAASLALGACSDDPDPADDPGAGQEPGRSLGLTEPGTVLGVGETARVPLEERTAADGDPNVIDLTLTAIDTGDPALLESLEGTPYFARMSVTAVSGDAQRFFPGSHVVAWAGDTQVLPLASPITVGDCSRVGFRAPEPALGSSLETCLTFVVEPGGPPVDRVAYYVQDGYDYQDGDAVEWR